MAYADHRGQRRNFHPRLFLGDDVEDINGFGNRAASDHRGCTDVDEYLNDPFEPRRRSPASPFSHHHPPIHRHPPRQHGVLDSASSSELGHVSAPRGVVGSSSSSSNGVCPSSSTSAASGGGGDVPLIDSESIFNDGTRIKTEFGCSNDFRQFRDFAEGIRY